MFKTASKAQTQQSIKMTDEVTKVEVSCSGSHVTGLKFSDFSKTEIESSITSSNQTKEQNYNQMREQIIPDGEYLIGCYGYLSPDYSYILNFGFITVQYK